MPFDLILSPDGTNIVESKGISPQSASYSEMIKRGQN